MTDTPKPPQHVRTLLALQGMPIQVPEPIKTSKDERCAFWDRHDREMWKGWPKESDA